MKTPNRTAFGSKTEELLGERSGNRALRLSDLEALLPDLILRVVRAKVDTLYGANGLIWTSGAGTPEGVVTAPVGSLFTRSDGGSGSTLYVKETGAGSTGWVAK